MEVNRAQPEPRAQPDGRKQVMARQSRRRTSEGAARWKEASDGEAEPSPHIRGRSPMKEASDGEAEPSPHIRGRSPMEGSK